MAAVVVMVAVARMVVLAEVPVVAVPADRD
ncbi:hypothetical protein U724_00200 [Pseudomonas chlororaphis subsp. aurantiaca PB-St2]|nr:hypothetical protein U724_00200 [Pseudomonas chlororaphis subsp. aurantiaca PB-St2]